MTEQEKVQESFNDVWKYLQSQIIKVDPLMYPGEKIIIESSTLTDLGNELQVRIELRNKWSKK